jgi:hypothetical protein
VTPYKLRADWRALVANRVIKDILYDHPPRVALSDVLLFQDKFRLWCHIGNGEKDNCNIPTAFKQRLTTSVAAKKTFCVALHLYDGIMATLNLNPRENLAPSSILVPRATLHAGAAPAAHQPTLAPKKLVISEDLDTKLFDVKNIQPL